MRRVVIQDRITVVWPEGWVATQFMASRDGGKMADFNLVVNQTAVYQFDPVDDAVVPNPSTVTGETVVVSDPSLVAASAVAGQPNQFSLVTGPKTGTVTVTVRGTNSLGVLVQTPFVFLIANPATKFVGKLISVKNN